ILRDARTVTYEFVERVGMRAPQDEGGTQQRVPQEQHRPVIAKATRSSSLSFSCAWSCACGWEGAGGGTPVSAIGSSCGSPCRRIATRRAAVAAASMSLLPGANTAP